MKFNKFTAFLENGEQEVIEIEHKYYASHHDYLLNHPKWKYFQYDGGARPRDYVEKFVEETSFNGYLIAVKKGKRWDVEECKIKIILDI